MEQPSFTITVACSPSRHKFINDVVDELIEASKKDPNISFSIRILWEEGNADMMINVGPTGRVGQPYSESVSNGFILNPYYLATSQQQYEGQIRSTAGAIRKRVRKTVRARQLARR